MITHSKALPEKEGFSLNLEQPLDRINQDIVQHILNSCNGNQTAAAKKLGISRPLYGAISTGDPIFFL